MKLFGLRVLLTRPEPDNLALANLLRAKDAIAIESPTLAIVPQNCISECLTLTPAWDTTAALVFVSRAAVRCALPTLLQHIPNIRQQPIHWAAMGAGTAALLQEYGIQTVIYPENQNGGAALLPQLLSVCSLHSQVVIFKGTGGLAELQTGLRAHSIKITEINCYRRVKLDIKPEVVASLKAGVDVMIATSADSLLQLRVWLEKWPHLLHQPLIVISQRLHTVARQQGFMGSIIVSEADNAAMIAAIERIA